MWLILVGGIHKHQTRDAVRVIRCEDANVETAAGRPYQHHRSANSTAAEEFGQLARDAAGCPRGRAGVAVAQACSVVGAHTRESRDIRLDETPASAHAAESRVEDDSRRTVPGAPQMQPVSSDVDEMSWRRSRCQVLTSRKPLIRGPRECSKDDQTRQADENAHRPTPHVRSSCRQVARLSNLTVVRRVHLKARHPALSRA